MSIKEISKAVNEEFGFEVAICVAIFYQTTNVGFTTGSEDYYNDPVEFVKYHGDITIHNYSKEVQELAYECWAVSHEWMTYQVLGWPKEYSAKTFKELIDKLKIK